VTDVPVTHFDALIVGAGFAGLYQLHCLRDKLALSVMVLEAADGVGGTWYWNRYPGARCDSESHSYGFHFSDELMREWEWTERFPAQDEVLRYINWAADRLDLKRDIRFNTRVIEAHYDEARQQWQLRTEVGERYSARFLITAVGCLSSANVPDFAGLEDFDGAWHHTGHWPADGVDFAGKRVGLIGTGSTGIQAAPVIAETAAHLHVFQRSATYSVPAGNHSLSPEFKRYVKDNAAQIRAAMHATASGHPFANSDRLAVQTPANERQALYEAAWQKGGLQFRATFGDILLDQAANDTAAQFVRDKIRSIVKDPVTARKLSEVDHPYATKRPPIDTNYYDTFNRDNVTLVDVRAAPIERITAQGIRTREGFYPLDTIVFATGYDAVTGPLLRMGITGRGGRALADEWQDGPRTYLGLQVPGFPNLFTITGPGSPSVLTNMPVAIEQHVEWITDCIAHLRERGLHSVEAKPDARDRWVDEVNEAAAASLLSSATTSWYHGANVPGKPRVFMPYAGGMARYRQICAEVAANDYEGFTLSAS
jgi:cation diffusion facilitator CzcD-associated flavoprotein CzcO